MWPEYQSEIRLSRSPPAPWIYAKEGAKNTRLFEINNCLINIGSAVMLSGNSFHEIFAMMKCLLIELFFPSSDFFSLRAPLSAMIWWKYSSHIALRLGMFAICVTSWWFGATRAFKKYAFNLGSTSVDVTFDYFRRNLGKLSENLFHKVHRNLSNNRNRQTWTAFSITRRDLSMSSSDSRYAVRFVNDIKNNTWNRGGKRRPSSRLFLIPTFTAFRLLLAANAFFRVYLSNRSCLFVRVNCHSW